MRLKSVKGSEGERMKMNSDACDYSCRKKVRRKRGAGATKPREQEVNRNSHGNKLALLPINIVHNSANPGTQTALLHCFLAGNGTLLIQLSEPWENKGGVLCFACKHNIK